MRFVIYLSAFLVAVIPLSADELADARTALDALGVKASSTGVVLAKEAELTKELNKGAGLKRNVFQAEKELKAVEAQVEAFERGFTQLRVQHIQLSTQLANINPNDIALNNKLVGALRAIEGQFELGKQRQTAIDTQLKTSRGKLNEAREAYIELALASRRLADEIEEAYSTKAASPDVKAALARFNQAAGKQFVLNASPGFQANVRRLKQLEDTVHSESIDLQDDGSKTMHVNVVVNGRYQQEMVLDSGASLISLPPSVAAKFGLKPSDKDPRITLKLADGREIDGRLMKLTSVRIGKFQVDNVECTSLATKPSPPNPFSA